MCRWWMKAIESGQKVVFSQETFFKKSTYQTSEFKQSKYQTVWYSDQMFVKWNKKHQNMKKDKRFRIFSTGIPRQGKWVGR